MNSLSRQIAAAPRVGQACVQRYGQAAAVAGTGVVNGMTTQPRRAVLPPLLCTCSLEAVPILPLLPLQTRRGAARASKRSPTVRRNERQQQQNGLRGANAAAIPGSASDGIFPSDLSAIGPALDYAISAQGSVLTRDECLQVLESVRRILRDKIKVTEESLLRGEFSHNLSFPSHNLLS